MTKKIKFVSTLSNMSDRRRIIAVPTEWLAALSAIPNRRKIMVTVEVMDEG